MFIRVAVRSKLHRSFTFAAGVRYLRLPLEPQKMSPPAASADEPAGGAGATNAVQQATCIPELVAAVLANFVPERASVGSRQRPAAKLGTRLRRELALLGRARLVCRLWAAEGQRLQWRSASATQLARVDAAATQFYAALVARLDTDASCFGSIAGVSFPRLRELRVREWGTADANMDELYDLLARCGRGGGDATAAPMCGMAASTLRSVKLYSAGEPSGFRLTETLLMHLARHPQLRCLLVNGVLRRALLERVSTAATEAGDDGSVSAQESVVACSLFRQLRELDIAVAPDALAPLIRLLAGEAWVLFTHFSIRIEGDAVWNAPVPIITASPAFQRHLRSLCISFAIVNDPRLTANDMDGLCSLTQLTELSLIESFVPGRATRVEFAPDVTLAKLTELLASVGGRLTTLKLDVADTWLSRYTTLDLYARHCPLLRELKVAGDYSLDALDDAPTAQRSALPGDTSGGAAAAIADNSLGRAPRPLFSHLEVLRIGGCIRSYTLNRLRTLRDTNVPPNSDTLS
jgi:hypothetical protein